MTNAEILRHVDHTLLQAVATWDEIKTLCDEAVATKRPPFACRPATSNASPIHTARR